MPTGGYYLNLTSVVVSMEYELGFYLFYIFK